ncbi:hypothetical protein DPMN_194419 [Dreissena polymorpha]|uniref:Uncharacterized protein n=1 Tax=Dreissena polymorpha TaxID=45954 RepID=A0A9D3XZG1_DREPO|nr:hypothetical protein DPMN_194419 [Dreissena polymorpha]
MKWLMNNLLGEMMNGHVAFGVQVSILKITLSFSTSLPVAINTVSVALKSLATRLSFVMGDPVTTDKTV